MNARGVTRNLAVAALMLCGWLTQAAQAQEGQAPTIGNRMTSPKPAGSVGDKTDNKPIVPVEGGKAISFTPKDGVVIVNFPTQGQVDYAVTVRSGVGENARTVVYTGTLTVNPNARLVLDLGKSAATATSVTVRVTAVKPTTASH